MRPADANRRETSLHCAGWRVVLLCFVMAVLCWGLGFYGHGFYLAELKRQHGWPTALISSASTTCYLFSWFQAADPQETPIKQGFFELSRSARCVQRNASGTSKCGAGG